MAKAKDDGETAEIYRLQRDDVTLLREIAAAHRGDAEATVGKVLDASFDRLKEEWQLLLVRSSVLRGGVTVVAAQAMVAEVTLPDLRELARRSFWQEQRQGEDWVFEFLPLIRRYLGLKAGEMGQVEVAHQKAIEYFQGASVPWDGTLASCEAKFELCHHLCELGQFGAAYAVINTRLQVLERQGYYRELVTVYEQLTREWEAQTSEEEKNLGWGWTRLGCLYWNLGKYSSAIAAHQQAQRIFRTLDNQEGIAASLGNQGLVYQFLGEYQRAIDFLQPSLKIYREIGVRNGEAASLGNFGNTYHLLGQYERALDFHRQHYEIARQIGYRNGEGISLMNLGNAYHSLGQYQRAIDFLQKSLEIDREIGYRGGEANSLGNLGTVYQSLEQYERAIDFHLQSLEIKREISDRNGEGISLGNLGIAYRSLGQYQKALNFYEQSLEIKREIGYRRGEAQSLQSLAVLYHKCGRIQEGFAASQAATEIFMELELPLDAWAIPTWQKNIAKFAQRGKWHFVLCFIAGVFAFPFFLMFIVSITLWRLILGRFHR